MARASLFASLTALGAFIAIPVGPVMITLQTFIVLLSGILLGPKLGALSQIIYILLGLVGLPIFSGFNGGMQSFFRPSFGFLIGFIFASFLIGKILYSKGKHNIKPSFIKIFLSSLSGSIVIYIFGLPYMYFILNVIMNLNLSLIQVIKMGCLIFLPGDLIKIILASLSGLKLLPAVNKFLYSEV